VQEFGDWLEKLGMPEYAEDARAPLPTTGPASLLIYLGITPSRSSARSTRMTNLLAQTIDCDDANRVAKIIRDALGIESDDVVNYCFPTEWPTDRERRARYIGEWLKTEARYLAS
jgi:hypothetical protein